MHETLHLLLEVVKPRNAALAQRFETAKNELEVTLGYLFQGRDPTPGFRALIAVTDEVMKASGFPAPAPYD